MKVKFVTRVFMPNNDYVLSASTPEYAIELLPIGWVKVVDVKLAVGLLLPPHQVEMVLTDDHKQPKDPATQPPASTEPPDSAKKPRGRPPKVH